MPKRPTDEELTARLAEEHERQDRSRRNHAAMNALLRGQPVPEAQPDTDGDPAGPVDMNSVLRNGRGRTPNPKETK